MHGQNGTRTDNFSRLSSKYTPIEVCMQLWLAGGVVRWGLEYKVHLGREQRETSKKR